MARTVDTCFVAMTRPAVKWGVPFEGFVANTVVTGLVTMLIVQSPPGFLLGIVVHFALRELCRVNPHFFHQWKLYFATKMRSTRTAYLWGGSRLQPSPSRVRSADEMPTSV